MGLLPPLRGIYRSDTEDPDGRVWEHCGYISFLDPAISVVATSTTAYLCKAIQDCGAHQFEGEI